MRVFTLAPLLLLAAGCGAPSYRAVVGQKAEPIVSRSVFVPQLREQLPQRVLVVHPRWGTSTDGYRSAIERGLMSRGVQVRFVDPARGPMEFGDPALHAALKEGPPADAILEVSTLTTADDLSPRYLVYSVKERGFVDTDPTTFFAAHPYQRLRLLMSTFVLTARLIDLASEKLASYHLSLPMANYPYPGVLVATLTPASDEHGPTWLGEEAGGLVIVSGNDKEVFTAASGEAARELLLEQLGRELPGKPAPAPEAPPEPAAAPAPAKPAKEPAKEQPAR